MKATPIPAKSRELVGSRDRWRCVRCAMPSPRGHWHHRRSRSVRDAHTHCSCNGVTVCPPCHGWIHANPEKARYDGLIVTRYDLPMNVSFKTPTGWVRPDCHGGWTTAF